MSNEPRFEVFPEMSAQTSHDTDSYDISAYHPSGDEYTLGVAHCNTCDWETRGDPADTRDAAARHEREHPKPTGQFAWHFKDANNRITVTGGESFTRREDAHRAILAAAADVLGQVFNMDGQPFVDIFAAPNAVFPTRIVDLDENDKVIA